MSLEDDALMGGDGGNEAPPQTIDQPREDVPRETDAGRDDRARDESGRFAPRGEPRGNPDQEAARRRETAERDQYKRELEEERAKRERLEKRFTDMQSLARGEEPEAAKPDPIAEIAGKVDQITQRFQQQDESTQREQAWAQIRSQADADEQRFSQQTPDFSNAVQHYITSRLSEMEALGADQQQAQGILQQEAQQLLIQCAQTGRSPAESLYRLAQARGYQPGAAPRQQEPMGGAAALPRTAGGRSLGTGGGAASGGHMTAQQIAAMGEADYMAFRATPEGRRAIQRAMGG